MIPVIFALFFNIITSFLGLPIAWHWDTFIMSIVGAVVFPVAFKFVGGLYKEGVIHSRTAGSVIHWSFRLVLYFIIWLILYVIIEVVRFVFAHWVVVVSCVGGVLLLSLTAMIIYNHKKAVKKNASNER